MSTRATGGALAFVTAVISGVSITTAMLPATVIVTPAALAAENTAAPVRCGSGTTANLENPAP